MARKLYVDYPALSEKIEQSGVKIGFICEKLGISRAAWNKKKNGISSFRAVEVFAICSILGISEQDKEKIFLPIDAT